MVYCTKCGTQDLDDSANCSKCGAPLSASQPHEPWAYRRSYSYHRHGSIWGIMIGLFILAIGVSSLLGWSFWDWLWPGFLILIGLAIIFGTVSRGRW